MAVPPPAAGKAERRVIRIPARAYRRAARASHPSPSRPRSHGPQSSRDLRLCRTCWLPVQSQRTHWFCAEPTQLHQGSLNQAKAQPAMRSRRCRNKRPRACAQHSPARPHPRLPRSQAPTSPPPRRPPQPSPGTGRAVPASATLAARELAGIFLKIKAVSFPTCYSFGKRGQPARSTISQLVHARSSPLASDYRELHFGSWFFLIAKAP